MEKPNRSEKNIIDNMSPLTIELSGLVGTILYIMSRNVVGPDKTSFGSIFAT